MRSITLLFFGYMMFLPVLKAQFMESPESFFLNNRQTVQQFIQATKNKKADQQIGIEVHEDYIMVSSAYHPDLIEATERVRHFQMGYGSSELELYYRSKLIQRGLSPGDIKVLDLYMGPNGLLDERSSQVLKSFFETSELNRELKKGAKRRAITDQLVKKFHDKRREIYQELFFGSVIEMFENLSPTGRSILWETIKEDTSTMKQYYHFDPFKDFDTEAFLEKYDQLYRDIYEMMNGDR